MAADPANQEKGDVWLSLSPNGSGRLDCCDGGHEFFWQLLDPPGVLAIIPREARYCQPGPRVGLRQMGNGTCRIQVSHESLLPGGPHEFFKCRDDPVATLVSGEVFRLARSKWLLGAGGALVIAAVGLYWRLPGGTILDPIKAILSLLIAAAGFVTCLRWLLPKDRRLVIGRDRVQLVHGKETVVGQLPYDLIASVHFFHGEEGEESFFYRPGVTIRLADLSRPDTFWPGTPNGQLEFVLQDRFECSPEELRKALRSRWQGYKRKQELAESPPGEIPTDIDMVG
jgi:hypothetical protein